MLAKGNKQGSNRVVLKIPKEIYLELPDYFYCEIVIENVKKRERQNKGKGININL